MKGAFYLILGLAVVSCHLIIVFIIDVVTGIVAIGIIGCMAAYLYTVYLMTKRKRSNKE